MDQSEFADGIKALKGKKVALLPGSESRIET
jgi:hypothetical protein